MGMSNMRLLLSVLSFCLLAMPAAAAEPTSCAELTRGRDLPCTINFAGYRYDTPAVTKPIRTRMVRSAAELNALEYQPGDEIILANGPWADARINVQANGTAVAPIIIRGETPSGVTFTGTSAAQFSGSYITLRDIAFRNGLVREDTGIVLKLGAGLNRPCGHCRAERVTIDNFNPAPRDWEKLKTFYIAAQGESITIENSTFTNKQNVGGIVIAPDPNDGFCDRGKQQCVQRLIFRNNRISSVSKDVRHGRLEAGKFVAMQIGGSRTVTAPSFSIIEGNQFEHIDGGTNTLAIKVSDIIIRDNRFTDNLGTIDLRATNRALVMNNTFDGTAKPGMGGIDVTGRGHWIVRNVFRNLLDPINDFHIPISMPASEDEELRDGSNRYARPRDVVIADNTFDNISRPAIALGVFPKGGARTLMPADIYLVDNTFRFAGQAARAMGNDDGLIKFIGPRDRFANIRVVNNRVER